MQDVSPHDHERLGVEPVRRFKLRVRNTGGETLDNCLVKLTDLRGSDDVQRAFVPIGLVTEHQHYQRRPGGKFNLRPGEDKLIWVASLDERRPAGEIQLYYEASNYPNMLARDNYSLEITAYGSPTPHTKCYRMYVTENGEFRLEEAL